MPHWRGGPPAGLSVEGSTAEGVELPPPTVGRDGVFLVVRGVAKTNSEPDGRVDIEFIKDAEIIELLTTRLAGKPGGERTYEVFYNYQPPAGTTVKVRYVSAANAVLEDSSGILFETGAASGNRSGSLVQVPQKRVNNQVNTAVRPQQRARTGGYFPR